MLNTGRPSLVTYLFRTTGQVIGVSISGAVLQSVLLRSLRAKITGPDAEDIIEAVRCARPTSLLNFANVDEFSILKLDTPPPSSQLWILKRKSMRRRRTQKHCSSSSSVRPQLISALSCLACLSRKILYRQFILPPDI